MSTKATFGQYALATGNAENLPLQQGAVGGIALKAMPANTGIVYVGGDNTLSSTNGFPLSAGESITLNIPSLNKVWVRGTATDRVAWGTVGY